MARGPGLTSGSGGGASDDDDDDDRRRMHFRPGADRSAGHDESSDPSSSDGEEQPDKSTPDGGSSGGSGTPDFDPAPDAYDDPSDVGSTEEERSSSEDNAGDDSGRDSDDSPQFDPAPDAYDDPEDVGSTEAERSVGSDSRESDGGIGEERDDQLVVTEEGSPDADNPIIESRLNQAETYIAENYDLDREDYTLEVTDTGGIEFGGLTASGEMQMLREHLREEYPNADGTDVTVTDDGEVVGRPIYDDEPMFKGGRPNFDPSPDAYDDPSDVGGSALGFDPAPDAYDDPSDVGGSVAGEQPDEVEAPDGEHVMTRGQDKGPDIGTDEFEEGVVEARVARQNKNLDPDDILAEKRSAEGITNPQIRGDISKNPYRIEQEEKFGDFFGEHLPGVEKWADEFAEENDIGLPYSDKIENAAESAEGIPLILPTGQRINTGAETTKAFASSYADTDLSEAPKGALEGAETVEYLVAPDQMVKGFRGEQDSASKEVKSRFSEVGEAGSYLAGEAKDYAAANPNAAIGKGTFIAGGILAGSVAETAALRSVTRGARAVTAPDISSVRPAAKELKPDVSLRKSEEAPLVDANINTNLNTYARTSRTSVRKRVGDITVSKYNDVKGGVNYARLAGPQTARSLKESAQNVSGEAAQSARRLARDIGEFQKNAAVNLRFEASRQRARAGAGIQRFVEDDRSGSAPPGPVLRDEPFSSRRGPRELASSFGDEVRGRVNYARLTAARRAESVRELPGDIRDDIALSGRRLVRDIREYRQKIEPEIRFAFDERVARGEEAVSRFSDDTRSGSPPAGPILPSPDRSAQDLVRDIKEFKKNIIPDIDFSLDTRASRGRAALKRFANDERSGSAPAGPPLPDIDFSLDTRASRGRAALKRFVNDERSGSAPAGTTLPDVALPSTGLEKYSLRVDIGKPSKRPTRTLDVDALEDVEVKIRDDGDSDDTAELGPVEGDEDPSSGSTVEIDQKDDGSSGGQITKLKQERRYDVGVDEPGPKSRSPVDSVDKPSKKGLISGAAVGASLHDTGREIDDAVTDPSVVSSAEVGGIEGIDDDIDVDAGPEIARRPDLNPRDLAGSDISADADTRVDVDSDIDLALQPDLDGQSRRRVNDLDIDSSDMFGHGDGRDQPSLVDNRFEVDVAAPDQILTGEAFVAGSGDVGLDSRVNFDDIDIGGSFK